MGFMKAYKRLDNLCKDRNGIGVTGYIKDMESIPEGESYGTGWKNDYRQLKYYRWIRNQIAHEIDADENEMSSVEDKIWLDNFYERMMNQTDPLAQHYKKTKPQSAPIATTVKKQGRVRAIPSNGKLHHSSKSNLVFYILLLLIMGAILILFLFSLMLLGRIKNEFNFIKDLQALMISLSYVFQFLSLFVD